MDPTAAAQPETPAVELEDGGDGGVGAGAVGAAAGCD